MQPIRVLIVDDSGFFRKRIHDLVAKDDRLIVVGAASNGREAVAKCKQLKPDVVTMDVEMPDMNGIDAVQIIMRDSPTSILMLSSLTRQGANITLKALEAGASDFLTKDIRNWTSTSNLVHNEFTERLVKLGRRRRFEQTSSDQSMSRPSLSRRPTPTSSPTHGRIGGPSVNDGTSAQRAITAKGTTMNADNRKDDRSVLQSANHSGAAGSGQQTRAALAVRQAPGNTAAFPSQCRLVVIGASTGGPAALQKILSELPAQFPYPIILVQHMPKAFTNVFAARLNQQCSITVKEAEDGDNLRPGTAYLAPGGHQLVVDPRRPDRVRVLESDERVTYRPSVDITYASAAKALGNRVHAIILTGMGADGADGARLLKKAGATIWAQNKESCTIYGMPQAIVKSGLADEVLDLNAIGGLLSRAGRR
ncbi:protein-glutamate methylesterase/protein-glutamine glutaminase [Neptunomonas phycophila]|uniref:protein-glutamate methylesterase/protein-glutamine glutaminase n=1 Tax=Neptunomonas phycophila TaxID=1572645 RepID=UPI0023F96EF4|nr:chemotaxis response regulator protein-glutamate methylesterase [Neptunomonas phycophila]